MGFIIILIIISAVAGIITGLYDEKKEDSFWNGFVCSGGACMAVSVFICLFIFTISYFNYVGLMQWKTEIESVQNQALSVYISYANTPLGAEGKIVSDLNDKKYENFQNNLFSMIKDLKNTITKYNDRLISKRVYKNTWFWGALIVLPEDPGIYEL